MPGQIRGLLMGNVLKNNKDKRRKSEIPADTCIHEDRHKSLYTPINTYMFISGGEERRGKKEERILEHALLWIFIYLKEIGWQEGKKKLKRRKKRKKSLINGPSLSNSIRSSSSLILLDIV